MRAGHSTAVIDLTTASRIKASATGNLIGGAAVGAGNLIAFNALDGVYLVNGTGNSVLGNQMALSTVVWALILEPVLTMTRVFLY